MHQGAWLAWTTCAAGVAIATTNPFYLLPLVACAYIVHARHLREGPSARAFRIFVLVGLFAVATRSALVLFDIEHASTQTLVAALLEGSRLATILIVYGTFNSVTDPFRVLRLAPRRFHEPALAAALALSIAPRTIQAVGQVREAQRLRGMPARGLRSLPALAIPVLETGMEEAVILAESMDARGHGRGPRSRYRPDRWSRGATITSVSAVAALLAFIMAAVGGDDTLILSAFPLRWPEVSPALIACVFLLGVPTLIPPEDEERA